MIDRRIVAAVAAGLLAVTAACAAREDDADGAPSSAPAPAATPAPQQGLPAGHPPIGGADRDVIPDVPEGAGTGAAGLAWSVPDGWIEEAPSSSFRRAQYRVPGPGGDAVCAVFYFGPGQGGEPMANARRWASQFVQPDGRSSLDVMTTRTLEVGPIRVLMVEVTGTYSGGMGGPSAAPQRDAMLLGAIAEGPDANWFFKLTGPKATVAPQRDAFEGMLRSLRPGEGAGNRAQED